MPSQVVSIRVFSDLNRSEIDPWALGWAIRALISGEIKCDGSDHLSKTPVYLSNPSPAPAKPHLFKRMYEKALSRFTVSWRVTQEQATKLKAIPNWLHRLRSYFYSVTLAERARQEEFDYDNPYENLEVDQQKLSVALMRTLKKIRTTKIFVDLGKEKVKQLVGMTVDNFYDLGDPESLDAYFESLKKHKVKWAKENPFHFMTVYYNTLIKELTDVMEDMWGVC